MSCFKNIVEPNATGSGSAYHLASLIFGGLRRKQSQLTVYRHRLLTPHTWPSNRHR